MRLAFHNFWYNRDNNSSRGVRFRATCLSFEGDLPVPGSVDNGCWVGLVGTECWGWYTGGGRYMVRDVGDGGGAAVNW